MSERDTQIERDGEVGLTETATSITDTSRERDAVGPTSGADDDSDTIFSSRALAIALVLTVAGAVLFGMIPFIGFLGNLLGIVAGGFAYGLGTDARRYLEMALAGSLAGGGAVLLGSFVLSVLVTGGTLIAISAVAGGVAGAVGHYFGRDFRAGLTQDLGEPP